MNIIKQPEALKILSISRATFYKQQNQRLIPKCISLGLRSVGYLKEEINELLQARIAGKSSCELKKLVIELEEKRKVKVTYSY